MNELKIEDLISSLEENAEKLKSGTLSLDENISLYNQSLELYKQASELLNSTKQKVEMFDPEKQEVKDFLYE